MFLQESYKTLQGYIAHCDLQIKDPSERARFTGGRYKPLPEKRTVEWYARSLAPVLNLEPRKLEEISQRSRASFQAWLQTLESESGDMAKNGSAEEEFTGEEELSDEEEEEEDEEYDLSYMSIECDVQPSWDI